MSFTFDASVLLYASDETSSYHRRARAFLLERVAGGRSDLIYLFWPTVMAYLRIATHPSVFDRPLPPADAVANVDRLLALPHVQTTRTACARSGPTTAITVASRPSTCATHSSDEYRREDASVVRFDDL